MTDRQFQRRIEDFTCMNCGAEVSGDGYTNHCPQCLHSRHVDINPGDRAADCGGLMVPVAVDQKRGDYILLQRCVQCGHERKNKVSPADSRAALVKLAQDLAFRAVGRDRKGS